MSSLDQPPLPAGRIVSPSRVGIGQVIRVDAATWGRVIGHVMLDHEPFVRLKIEGVGDLEVPRRRKVEIIR